MGITNFKLALEKRYSALTGQLEHVHATIARIKHEASQLDHLEAEIGRLESLIESSASLLLDAYPDWTPAESPPLQPWTHQLPVPFGTCGRRAMEILRKASKPLTTREIALAVLVGVNCADPDQKTIQRTVNACEASLRKHRGRTVESSGKYPAQWRTIAKPDIEFDC